jgi:ParB family transcriptional regulator, chromosome partitioning protein
MPREAVLVFAPEHVARLAKLKKGDLASEAERLGAGTGWLPPMLCRADAHVGRAADTASDDPTEDTSDEHRAESEDTVA